MDLTNHIQIAVRRSGLLKVAGYLAGGTAGATAMIYVLLSVLHAQATADVPLTGSYATRMGEHRCETLPDQSRTCLNTNSVIRYTFNQKIRNVELVSGEASFDVKSEDHRPFNVLSGHLLIHDLSTSFEVYKKPLTTVVTVLEGQVKVLALADLAAFQKLSYAESESAWRRAPIFKVMQQVEFDESAGTLHVHSPLTKEQLIQLTAWQLGRIDLNGLTLREALREFARYQPVDKITIADRTLRNFRVGGEIYSVNMQDFLDSLEVTYGIHYAITTGPNGQLNVTLSRQALARTK
jgi:transmembrane sensor